MPLVRNETPVRIALTTPGEWVDVKPRMSAGDDEAIKRAMVAGSKVVSGQPSAFDAEGLLTAVTFAALERVIVDWSFRETDGIPVSKDNIRLLSTEDLDLIKDRVNDLYPKPRSEAERGN